MYDQSLTVPPKDCTPLLIGIKRIRSEILTPLFIRKHLRLAWGNRIANIKRALRGPARFGNRHDCEIQRKEIWPILVAEKDKLVSGIV